MNATRITMLAALMLLVGVTFGFAPAPVSDSNGIPDKVIRWRAGERLSWKDFEGIPERGSYMDATTESGIVFNWSCDWKGFEVEAYAIFDPSKSWIQKNQATDYLLRHEQAHFDITEIHARKLRKRFAELGNPCRLGRSGISEIAQEIYDASAATQNQYDRETRHSKNRDEQARWLKKISNELKALSAYSEIAVNSRTQK